jgi:succinoglycan biosynthesis protein ExoM
LETASVITQPTWQTATEEYMMERAARGDVRAAAILRGLLADRIAEKKGRGAVANARVVIGVCTAKRPAMLRHCVQSIGQQIIPKGIDAHLVVVDNEPEPKSRGIVRRFSKKCPFPVHFVHEPRRGIPLARNAVVEKAVRLGGDWIAFTDDDCWASPTWLLGLLEAADRYKADVVYGRRQLVLPPTFWGVSADQPVFQEGDSLRIASTHNVLLAGRLVAEGKDGALRFDEQLTHGEDTDFFYRAGRRGVRIAYSRAPVVFETVPPERATLRYQTKRAYYYAASRSYLYRRQKSILHLLLKVLDRLMLKAPLAIARLGVAPLVWPIDELAFKMLVLKGTARLAGAAGSVAGLLAMPGNPYAGPSSG